MPEVVLIDGRFRVACFLCTVMHASPDTVIIFDDYADRPPDHVVEEVIAPVEVNERQAEFFSPHADLTTPAAELPEKFEFVMD